MSELQTFLREKPYEFVPLVEQCKTEKYSGHHIMGKNTYAGRLRLKIKTESPVHIGGKQQDYDENGNVIYNQMRRNGKMIIPGSSLKGAVRSIAEAVSYSCAVKLPHSILEPKKLLPSGNQIACYMKKKNELCITCSMFGMMSKPLSYKGKVNFGEFVLQNDSKLYEKLPLLETPFKDYPEKHDVFGYSSKKKSTYGNERLYYCRACESGNCQDCSKKEYFEKATLAGPKREMRFRGRKFYNPDYGIQQEIKKTSLYEFIAPQSTLEGDIIFQNLSEEECMLLAYSLGIGRQFTLKLGYGKPLGYGKVKIDLAGVESISSRYPEEKAISADLVQRWAQEYPAKCPADIQPVIREFERIMK